MAAAAMDKYDFIELMVFDIHCVAKGRMMARRRMDEVYKNGTGLYTGLCYFGIRDQPVTHDYFGSSRSYGNVLLRPILETLKPVLRSARGKRKVGQVLCYLQHRDGVIEPTTPRTVAQIQIDRLKDIGYTIRSSFELEFGIRHADTGKNFGHSAKWATLKVIDDCQELFHDFIEELDEIGVKVDTVIAEAGPGQYEFTLDIEEGIAGPDATAQFKHAAKVFFKKRNLDASFMTKFEPDGISNGFHFNHSLWTADGQNVFLNHGDPEKLTELGRHWLAGLITHAGAMTALSAPTLNCYRRFNQPWAPTFQDWGLQNRLASYRLKVEGKDNVYIENRIPSSACNPYLVMACVVAAGLDGINRKLRLEDVQKDKRMPKDLDSALNALQEDTILVEALGKDFVEVFTDNKRKFEIDHFKCFGVMTEEERFAMEKEFYFMQC